MRDESDTRNDRRVSYACPVCAASLKAREEQQ